MKKTVRSLGHSLEGFAHAVKTERNLRLFLIGHCVVLIIGFKLGIDFFSLVLTTIFAGLFLMVELLNTAIERLADTVDDCEKTHRGGHYHLGIKQTKDVAAAGSLIALLVYLSTLLLAILPSLLSQFPFSS